MTYGLLALLDPLLAGCRGWRINLKMGRGSLPPEPRGVGQTPLESQEIWRLRILLECSLMLNLFISEKKSLKIRLLRKVTTDHVLPPNVGNKNFEWAHFYYGWTREAG